MSEENSNPTSRQKRNILPKNMVFTVIGLIGLIVFTLFTSACSSSSASPEKTSKNNDTSVEIPDSVTSGDAMQVLDSLTVKGRAPKTGYSREQFGPAWADTDHNGCDTRNDILRRDLLNPTFKEGTHDCVVLTGTLNDPYTATAIDFVRGEGTSEKVQIDHVVALSNAWQTGAQKLTADQRKQLANDPYNLLAVDGASNSQKSDGDAATWLPANKDYRCEYVARQIGVKQKYSLWVTAAEKNAMTTVLEGCPTQTIPQTGGASVTPTPPAPAEEVVPTPAPQPQQAPKPAPAPAPKPTPAPAPAPRPAPAPAPRPSGRAHGGAFCSPNGAQMQSDRSSNILTCKPAKDGRLRWQR